jgi:iron complex outermembrane receptor protein
MPTPSTRQQAPRNRTSSHWVAVALGTGIGLSLANGPAFCAATSLEEIVVTATRKAAPSLRTPLSIGRIGAADVLLVGSTHHSEILNRVAGTMIQRGSGQESLTAIRSPVLTGAGSCGAFLMLENSVPIRPVGFCNVNELFEVNTEQADAIEVLRGPATAL